MERKTVFVRFLRDCQFGDRSFKWGQVSTLDMTKIEMQYLLAEGYVVPGGSIGPHVRAFDTGHINGEREFSYSFQRSDADRSKRTVNLSFSSEEPVQRFWGIEILDHTESGVNLTRLKRGGPLLLNHDPTSLVGVVAGAAVVSRRGHATVRFSKSARGEETFQDVLDGILTNVSVGYQIDKLVLEKKPDTYRATKWTPLEISLVSVPADINVGVGRAD